MSRRAGLGLAVGTSALAAVAGYWAALSPYSQMFGAFPHRAPTDHMWTKTVALTFDDGPNEPYTSQIAAYLDERAIKGTFFQVGRCVERHPDASRSLMAAGHVIGNHSYSHRFGRCWNPQDLARELELSQQVFGDTIGCQPALYRPP